MGLRPISLKKKPYCDNMDADFRGVLMSKTRVLVVEDEKEIGASIKRRLELEQFEVYTAEDGISGYDKFNEIMPQLVILDLMLPGMDGTTFCSRLRADKKNTPVLMLTAKGTVQDKISGLNCGADDYMTKPFDLDELLARINALLRRERRAKAPSKITVDTLEVDPASHEVKRSGKSITLTAKEYELLELLATRSGELVSREEIFEKIWGYDFEGESNIIDVYIRYLRSKVDLPGEKKLIHTLRGAGYMLKG